MWGRPVHLDTQFKLEGTDTPVRITIENTIIHTSPYMGMGASYVPGIKTTWRKLNKTIETGEEKWVPDSTTLHETKEEIKD